MATSPFGKRPAWRDQDQIDFQAVSAQASSVAVEVEENADDDRLTQKLEPHRVGGERSALQPRPERAFAPDHVP